MDHLVLLKMQNTFVSNKIYIFSEVCIKGILYRSHPCYHTIKNSWNDWGTIRYEIDNVNTQIRCKQLIIDTKKQKENEIEKNKRMLD